MVLPDAVLLPNALLPLYIFEKRYRQMLAFCLEHDRIFCVTLMKPGVSEAVTREDFFAIGGAGLVRACVEQKDGTSHLILQGLARVTFANFIQDEPFRIAEIRELPSKMTSEVEAEALSAKVIELCEDLQNHCAEVPPALQKQLLQLSNPEVLSDVVAHAFVRDALQRQRILEKLVVTERLRLLIRYLGTEPAA